ncbi:hypothetical protein [Streptomyces sp. NPDC090080]|uniref:hypothetical protein n=1 Tax=Streptomyces sp. NPDC090080 TaxID=3365939 RepID=UPI0037F38C52
MQNKPVDVGRLGSIRCVVLPELRTGPDGRVRQDRDGNAQWVTGLSVRQAEGRRADVIEVVTSVQPQGIAEGAEVKIDNLWANDWAVDGRTGTSYRADGITPLTSTSAAPSAAGGQTAGSRAKGGDA